MAARMCMLSAAIWWAAFTIIPFRRLKNYQPADVEQVEGGNAIARSFGQLGATLREMKNYPMALTFLLAYLFFNDGIQTVIASASDVRRRGARLRTDDPDRHDLDGAVRRLLRGAAVRSARRALRREADDPRSAWASGW